MAPLTVMIGTFTAPNGDIGGGMDMEGAPSESHGVYSVSFDPSTGTFDAGTLALRADAGAAPGAPSPSWLRWNPNGLPVMYTNNETFSEDHGPGSVTAYAVHAGATGVQLALLNRLSTLGTSPCYVDVHPEGTHLAVANYSVDIPSRGGSVAIMSLDPRTGALVERTDWVQSAVATEPHIVEPRSEPQEDGTSLLTPHTHSCLFDPTGAWLLVGDVGNDRVTVYAFDQATGKITKHSEALVTPLGGARHLALSADSRFLYVNEEAGGRVRAFAWDAVTGSLTPLGPPLNTLVDESDRGVPGTGTADLQLSPDGTRLYCANRGSNGGGPPKQDTLATFAVDKTTGSLSFLAHTNVNTHPRHFRIDPTAQWMLFTAMHEDTIDVYRIGEDGVPTATGERLKVPTPTHSLFVEPALEDALAQAAKL